MDIQEINNDIITYMGQMIEQNDDYDFDNFSEDDFYDVTQKYLNDCINGYDIITEYYGNVNTFIPSLPAFIDMMDLITIQKRNYGDDTDWDMFMNSKNKFHRYCDVLRHYAFHYINSLGCELFSEKMKELLVDNFDYENSCDCCLKSWTDEPNEYGICECLCNCGDLYRNCKNECK